MDLDISLSPEILFNIGSFPVTNAFFWSVILSLFLIGITLFVRFSLKLVSGKLQLIFELFLEGGLSFIESIIGDKKKAKKIFPLTFTLFLFILLANLVTFIPGQAAISLHTANGTVAPFRAIMSDYSMVFVLTMIMVILAQVTAIIVHGPFGYLGKFFNFKSPLAFVLGLMDIIGELAKILSLSFRLFGNIFTGEVLGAVMLFLVPFIVPLPFAFLGLLTAVIQAFVFALLTLIFVNMSTEIAPEEAKQ